MGMTMITKSMLIAAAGLALLGGQAAAQASLPTVSPAKPKPAPSLERASASKGKVSRQFAEEMSLEMAAFLATGAVVASAIIYKANDKEGGKSPR